MGYRILGKTEQLLKGYDKIKGLEGPFIKGRNTILYYDPREGKYWNPRTDFYMSDDEINFLNDEMMRMFKQ